MLGSKPFLIIFEISLYYLTGQRFQTIVVKSCSRSANALQNPEKSDCVPTGE